MEDIIKARDPQLAAPWVVSDSLSANCVIGTKADVALCNAHGRREIAELSDQHLRLVLAILQLYQQE